MGRHFSQEQRNKIIDLHINQSYSTRRLAEDFNIGRTTIQNWLRKYREELNLDPVSPTREIVSQNSVNPARVMMLEEIKMQMEVLEAFQNELERWDQQD